MLSSFHDFSFSADVPDATPMSKDLTRMSHRIPATACCTSPCLRWACFILEQGVLTQPCVFNCTRLVRTPFALPRDETL